MKLVKDRGIVLKTEKSGETSLKVRLFAKDSGRMICIAKGARKPGSAFFGLLTPFSVVDFEMASSRYLPFIRSVSRIEYFHNLSQEPEKIVYASMIIEIVDKTAEPHEDIETLRLLYICLRSMNHPEFSAEKLHWWFIVHFLKIHGVWPDPETCAGCRRKLAHAVLIPDSGGLFCETCAGHSGTHGLSLDTKLREVLVFLAANPPEKSNAIRINRHGAVTLTRWLWKLLEVHYERTEFLNTKKAVERLL
ncbi:TPA: DNA repair protein RecO [Candidatus Marinimicrobia bacterium]|nr:MAG: DNA repair protein RecO [Marinimicrobia bacterium 46_43]HAE88201.1 DNA repair protein RecO [Candidatus Neomarinimicrobiota bacterium]